MDRALKRDQTLSSDRAQVQSTESADSQSHGLKSADIESNELESDEERRSRMRSLRFLSAITVLMCVCWSVTTNTVWPYLAQVGESDLPKNPSIYQYNYFPVGRGTHTGFIH